MVLMTKAFDSHIFSDFNALWNHTLWCSKLGHVAYVGASSHFGISSFLTLGGQTLSFINVTSFHLALVGDLKRNQSSLFFIPFVFTPLFSSHKKPQFLEKWRVLLPQVPTPQTMTRIRRALAMLLQWLWTLFLLFLILPSFLPPPQHFPS